jgi:hypothetical protein
MASEISSLYQPLVSLPLVQYDAHHTAHEVAHQHKCDRGAFSMKYVFYTCLFVLALTFSSGAHTACAATGSASAGAQQQPAKAQPDTPARAEMRSTAVAVTHEGVDSIGARLATRLKEAFNASNLFRLEEKDQPKMRLLLNTMSEFPSRPGVGSVYSVTWVFSQSEGHLAYLLSRDVGVLTLDEVDALAFSLLERTDGISVRYSYLFRAN